MSIFGSRNRDDEREEKERLQRIEQKLDKILSREKLIIAEEDESLDNENRLAVGQNEIISLLQHLPTGMTIKIIGERMSTTAGTSSNFQQAYTPTGSVPPAGTTQTWTVDVSDITLTPSADGTQCQAAVPAGETATSYNLTCTSSYTPPGAPTPISFTLNVPIVPAVVLPTGMTITQLS